MITLKLNGKVITRTEWIPQPTGEERLRAEAMVTRGEVRTTLAGILRLRARGSRKLC